MIKVIRELNINIVSFTSTQNINIPLNSNISWPSDESGEISLILDISSDSEVLLPLLKEMSWKTFGVLFTGAAGNDFLVSGKLLNLHMKV